jgi:hypothetical protein
MKPKTFYDKVDKAIYCGPVPYGDESRYIDIARLRRQVEERLRVDPLLVLDLGLKLGLITQD